MQVCSMLQQKPCHGRKPCRKKDTFSIVSVCVFVQAGVFAAWPRVNPHMPIKFVPYVALSKDRHRIGVEREISKRVVLPWDRLALERCLDPAKPSVATRPEHVHPWRLQCLPVFWVAHRVAIPWQTDALNLYRAYPRTRIPTGHSYLVVNFLVETESMVHLSTR